MPSDDLSRVKDMLDAARKAVAYAGESSRKALDSNEILALALVRLLEVVGEAARYVPDDIKHAYPDVPWREIAATRNRLAHGYFSVDLDIVWVIVQRDLPLLIGQLETILGELRS